MKRLITQATLAICTSVLTLRAVADGDRPPGSASRFLDLPVVATTERYPPYVEFCRREPTACELTGPLVLPHSPRLIDDLQQVTAAVNRTVRFTLDKDLYSVEDYWALPISGRGDCEDIALAKRARLVDLGYASAALRLAFVFNREGLSAHCVLTAETSGGTLVLDSHNDRVTHWSDGAYNFEARERPDGLWDRYDQSVWRFEDSAAPR